MLLFARRVRMFLAMVFRENLVGARVMPREAWSIARWLTGGPL